MFVVGINTGFRVSELLSITWGQVVSADREWRKELSIDGSLTKDGRTRTVPINTTSQEILQDWLQQFSRTNVAASSTPVFTVTGLHPVSRFAALRRLKTAFLAAGLPSCRRQLGTHCMRKTFAVLWFRHFCAESGGDLGSAILRTSKIMGHASIDNTVRYLESTSVFSRQLLLASESIGQRVFGKGAGVPA
jgi:integrase